jgi:hypothetical protein
MEWALEAELDAKELLEYEARLRTHPLVVIGGILQETPFFVPPDEILDRLHARRSA